MQCKIRGLLKIFFFNRRSNLSKAEYEAVSSAFGNGFNISDFIKRHHYIKKSFVTAGVGTSNNESLPTDSSSVKNNTNVKKFFFKKSFHTPTTCKLYFLFYFFTFFYI